MANRSRGVAVDGRGIGWPAPLPPTLAKSLLTSAGTVAAGFWLEAGVLGVIAAALAGSRRAGELPAAVLILCVALGVLVGVGPSRRWTRGLLHSQRVRRQWRHAIRVAAIPEYAGAIARVVRVRRIAAGERLRVRVPLGGTVGDLEDAAEVLAVALQVRDVRVERDLDNARRASVTIVRRDALATDIGGWPHLDADALSLWSAIPVGVDDDGEPVTVELAERNVLLGGEPGSGKSAALSMLVATAALDPTVRLHLFDGKLVELATWAGVAEHTVGVRTAEANDVLRSLQTLMDERYTALLANRARKVTPESGLGLHVVVVDELAHYLLAPDRKERTDFAELMRDLVARGRAAGIIVLAATQKPAHDVIPTALRDLFGFRWAMRCSTPQASDTVLGAGWASGGYSAAGIDARHRGVGYLLHEGGLPVRMRAHYLDDEQLRHLAVRAEALRKMPAPGGAG